MDKRREAILSAGCKAAKWLRSLETVGFEVDTFEQAIRDAGLCIVPLEPSEEMRAAFYDNENATNSGFARAYRAMIQKAG